MDGHLITCNPAARQVFGETIWLQSDIFGMGERERRGLNLDDIPITGGSFRIERTERRTAYEVMRLPLAALIQRSMQIIQTHRTATPASLPWWQRACWSPSLLPAGPIRTRLALCIHHL